MIKISIILNVAESWRNDTGHKYCGQSKYPGVDFTHWCVFTATVGSVPSLTSFTGNTTPHPTWSPFGVSCGYMKGRHKPWENIEPIQVMELETRKGYLSSYLLLCPYSLPFSSPLHFL